MVIMSILTKTGIQYCRIVDTQYEVINNFYFLFDCLMLNYFNCSISYAFDNNCNEFPLNFFYQSIVKFSYIHKYIFRRRKTIPFT